MTIRRLPAEWEPQDGVLIAWPHPRSDWAPDLCRVEPVFAEIIAAISRYERVLVLVEDEMLVRGRLMTVGADMANVRLLEMETNDTWARDFGPITVMEQGRPRLLDFGFNGWGLKFAACLDNQVTRRLHAAGIFGHFPLETLDLVLEGGSIESDGQGTILTTSPCLLEANRNPHLDRHQLEQRLLELLGGKRLLWLEHGYLAGDDTDSHIDTLARLAPDDTILYVSCDDPADEHFRELRAMELELKALHTADGRPYRLIPLPWPRPCHDPEGTRLPATYANFLVINDAVLVPIYHDPADEAALAAVGRAFPARQIIGIDCRPLLLQHGSLHCVTMQLPAGLLASA
jgi:agmatine deiminase